MPSSRVQRARYFLNGYRDGQSNRGIYVSGPSDCVSRYLQGRRWAEVKRLRAWPNLATMFLEALREAGGRIETKKVAPGEYVAAILPKTDA